MFPTSEIKIVYFVAVLLWPFQSFPYHRLALYLSGWIAKPNREAAKGHFDHTKDFSALGVAFVKYEVKFVLFESLMGLNIVYRGGLRAGPSNVVCLKLCFSHKLVGQPLIKIFGCCNIWCDGVRVPR